MPHKLLFSWLFSIEQATVAITRKYPRMIDKDVEAVYEAYREFFTGLSRGKDMDDPYSTLRHRQNLMDEIWEVIVHRERQQADDFVPAGEFEVSGKFVTDYDQFYAMGFNDLRKSVRFWRKRDGAKGYIKYVQDRVDEVLEENHSFHGRGDGQDRPNTLQESLDEFATKHGIALSVEPTRELPEDVTEEQAVYHRSFSRNPAAHVDRLREICADLPQYPQLTNDLIGALYAAGQTEEAEQLVEKMVAEHPDYLVGVSQYVSTGQEKEEILARGRALGPNREITDFTPGKGGRYHLQEFLLHETAVITVLTVERNYEESIHRLQRLMDLDIPLSIHYGNAERIAMLYIATTAEAMEVGADAAAAAADLPPAVVGAEAAVDLVRKLFVRIVTEVIEARQAGLN